MYRIFLVFVRNSIREVCDFERETCLALAAHNIVFAFLMREGISFIDVAQGEKVIAKEKNNLYFIRPLLLPFQRYAGIVSVCLVVNVFLLTLFLLLYKTYRKAGGLFLWIFHPRDYDLWKFIRYFYYSIYDVVDYFPARELKGSHELKEKQKLLVMQSQRVASVSDAVYASLKRYRVDVFLAPLGFRIETFQKRTHNSLQYIKSLLPDHKTPIVGYIGGINHRLDYDLLYKLALRCEDTNFVFIGPLQFKQDNNVVWVKRSTKDWVSVLSSLPNVYFSKRTIHWRHIPNILDAFDICMIPYDTAQEFNRFCYPMKIFYYFFPV